MKKISLYLLILPIFTFSQIGIGTTSPNASLDIRSSNQTAPANTDGLLIPKIDAFPVADPGVNQDGMLVYLTTADTHNSINYISGFHYWDNGSTRWLPITSIERINDLIDGKSDIDGSNDGSSIFLGISAGAGDDSSHNRNIGIGFEALNATVGADVSDPDGTNNVAIGFQSMRNNTTGRQNVAIGSFTLDENTIGFNNTAIGYNTLTANVDGLRNTAVGQSALSSNTDGNNNTAIGGGALGANTSGVSNVAIGAFSLTRNETGVNNVAAGNQSLRFNEDGGGNVAIGDYAGRSVDYTGGTTDDNNVFIGSKAGDSDVESSNNVYIGFQSGAGDYNPEDNTGTSESKSGNIFIGYQSGYNESNDNRLYIENSDAGQNGALVYGRFDNDLFRINGTLQVGNPGATSGYAFPTIDGTANQVLTTDGAGTVTWENSNLSMSAARATLSTAQTITVANTWTTINFDTVDFDLNSDFDTPNNQFDIPADGIYRITAMYTSDVNLNNSNTFGIRISVSGGANLQEVNYKHMNENSRIVRQVTTLAQLTAGQSIEIQARANVASVLVIDTASRFTSFSIERVR
ncbi:hypothetical protein BWZ20_07870 [Winogradskyella sp. J14-2]|uniref:hypothetical protein n=1 Tax=Winogradskyella sp. J14-2 TaxID=1936080 RepID=UPI000972A208|nr:hypothetical protein [Winogradskyella sp. J14-2]APY08223.1 hypothetical protein BWZ20_07870 [Winogradskyella sp. J14-2]